MILNLVLYALYLYIAIFAIYLFVLGLKSVKARAYFAHRSKNINEIEPRNLCVVIYGQEDDKNLASILELLNNQNYPRANYQVHFILQSADPQVARTLEFIGGAKIWRLENPEFFGKNRAIAVLLEKLMPNQGCDAFVFLGSKRYISDTFLLNVNLALSQNDVVVGKTEFFTNDLQNLKFKILTAKQKFMNKTFYAARTMLNLHSVFDSDACAFTRDAIEKIRYIHGEDKNDQMEFAIELAECEFSPLYSPFMTTYLNIEDYDFATETFLHKLKVLKNYMPLLVESSFAQKEALLSIFRPSAAFILIAYIIMAYCSFIFYFTLDISVLLYPALLILISLAIAASASKLSIKELLYICLYPVLSAFFKLKKTTKDMSAKHIKEENEQDGENSIVEQSRVNVIVTDGKKDVSTRLDLICEDGLCKVVFNFKKKRLSTDTHLRMFDAIKDLSYKLSDKGYRIKICQNCSYFKSKMDGSINMIKGVCTKCEPSLITLLWNNCNNFVAEDISSIIKNISQDM